MYNTAPTIQTRFTYMLDVTKYYPQQHDKWTTTNHVYGVTDRLSGIILIRAITGCSLKEAKDIADGNACTTGSYDIYLNPIKV